MSTTDVNTALIALATGLKMSFPFDRNLHNGVDKVLLALRACELAYTFDGVELRVRSFTDKAIEYVSDGATCTCKHRPRKEAEHCKHTILFRLLFAEAALLQPATLRRAWLESVEQTPEPLETPRICWACKGRFEAAGCEELCPTCAPRYSADQGEPDSLPTTIDAGRCRNCGAYLLDEELPSGVCSDCGPKPRPAAALAEPISFQSATLCWGGGCNNRLTAADIRSGLCASCREVDALETPRGRVLVEAEALFG